MRLFKSSFAIAPAVFMLSAISADLYAGKDTPVQLGPRPFYLVDKMSESDLKEDLQECAAKIKKYRHHDFSIGHRGAALQFPEHTKESYEAAYRMGAGILECDVTFTKDSELVCRHSQCDLHTTTDVVAREDLRSKCSVPPIFGTNDELLNAPDIECCTSDFTLAEFKSLQGKMDARDRNAQTVEEYLGGTANWRTDLYATGGTLLSHKESIELFKDLGAKFTPELKGGDAADINAIFGSQEAYAQAMIDDYKEAGIDPRDVWAQSFNLNDVLYWVNYEAEFGEQAVYLDGRYSPNNLPAPIDPNDPTTFIPSMDELAADGVRIIAPPMWMLLTVENGEIVPSAYAHAANAAGLKIISWTTERSGRIVEEVLPTKGTSRPSFYYQSTLDVIENDGDILTTIDVLAQEVGIIGLFSDWPATTSFYANCMLRKQKNRRDDDDDDDDDDD